MFNMTLDDLLITIIIAGIGLSGAYLRAQYALHISIKAAERRREALQRELHITQVHLEQSDVSRPISNLVSQILINILQLMRVLARALRIFIQENTYST
jgi:hypothetical protein